MRSIKINGRPAIRLACSFHQPGAHPTEDSVFLSFPRRSSVLTVFPECCTRPLLRLPKLRKMPARRSAPGAASAGRRQDPPKCGRGAPIPAPHLPRAAPPRRAPGSRAPFGVPLFCHIYPTHFGALRPAAGDRKESRKFCLTVPGLALDLPYSEANNWQILRQTIVPSGLGHALLHPRHPMGNPPLPGALGPVDVGPGKHSRRQNG